MPKWSRWIAGNLRQGLKLKWWNWLLSSGYWAGGRTLVSRKATGSWRSSSRQIWMVDGPPGSMSQEEWGRKRQYFQLKKDHRDLLFWNSSRSFWASETSSKKKVCKNPKQMFSDLLHPLVQKCLALQNMMMAYGIEQRLFQTNRDASGYIFISFYQHCQPHRSL